MILIVRETMCRPLRVFASYWKMHNNTLQPTVLGGG